MTIRPPAPGPRVRQAAREAAEGPRADKTSDDAPSSSVFPVAGGVTADGFEGGRSSAIARGQ
ncbi:MAG: hypothetical protein ACO3JL_06620, partial [Myxococcota bacterium]